LAPTPVARHVSSTATPAQMVAAWEYLHGTTATNLNPHIIRGIYDAMVRAAPMVEKIAKACEEKQSLGYIQAIPERKLPNDWPHNP
jgi:hypothetical protein